MQPHHGRISEMTSAEVVKCLERNNLAHLGCHDKKDVYVVPVTYVFDDGYIYSHSKEGKKIEMMRRAPRVCIQVEEIKNFFLWKSVIAWGAFEELHDQKADKGMRLLVNVLAQKSGERATQLEDFSALLEMAIIYRIKIEEATGRFEGIIQG